MFTEIIGQKAMIGPLIAQMGLTIAVFLYLFSLRIPILLKLKPSNKELTRPRATDSLPDFARFPADNFRNLAEVPILFYAACLTAMAGGMVDNTAITLAWTFVGFRALHSLIQCTYNKVPHRFLMYAISSVALIIMWGRMAWGYFIG